MCEMHSLSSTITAQEVWVRPGSHLRLKMMMMMSMMIVSQEGGTHFESWDVGHGGKTSEF